MARRGPIPDEAALARLAARLTADPQVVVGTARFAGGITDEEAAELAEFLERVLEGGLAERARAAEMRQLKVVCKERCNVCCEEPVIVYLPEALAIARWLAQTEHAEVRAHFVAAYQNWRGALGDAPERLAELNADDARREEYEAAYRRQWRMRVLCAFNHDGNCSIYPVRPLLCREGNALDTADHCVAGSPEPARRLTGGPVEGFMSKANLILRAAHNALDETPPNHAEMLCALVHRLLTDGRLA